MRKVYAKKYLIIVNCNKMNFIIWEDVLIVNLKEGVYLWEDKQVIQEIGKKIKYMEQGY